MHLFTRVFTARGLPGLSVFALAPAAVAESRDSTCTNPVWVSSSPGGGRDGPGIYDPDGTYINDNNMWNAAGHNVTQTMSVCSHASWYVDDTVPEPTTTAVKTYPNVHVDYINWSTGVLPALSSFPSIVSSYAGQGAGVGVYNVAYDAWLNGVGSPGSNEVMIWTENHGQRPAGAVVASSVSISGRKWDVWATSSNLYVAFVPPHGRSYPSGALDLKEFFNYLIQHGQLSSASTLGQIGYGVEVVSTGGGNARFNCTDFSLRPLS
jgi:hypothetical protein